MVADLQRVGGVFRPQDSQGNATARTRQRVLPEQNRWPSFAAVFLSAIAGVIGTDCSGRSGCKPLPAVVGLRFARQFTLSGA